MTPKDEKNKRYTRYPKRMSADLLPTLCPSRTAGQKEISGDFAQGELLSPKVGKYLRMRHLGHTSIMSLFYTHKD